MPASFPGKLGGERESQRAESNCDLGKIFSTGRATYTLASGYRVGAGVLRQLNWEVALKLLQAGLNVLYILSLPLRIQLLRGDDRCLICVTGFILFPKGRRRVAQGPLGV